ncbi:DinB family protein [Mucilaginibacter sp. X4EP1]|uniref:DinB family protein n=1 Tax=Mucilaginibacter sp. X4EP1 TaxID=2723092 RepID=UPI002166DCF7|nr:DinB family protein [Mucilaginibacter sp. X4EP1]MCS3811619.1 putative damage-inducible protein DinB [Mucilaginibacter sp. X4EP1]
MSNVFLMQYQTVQKLRRVVFVFLEKEVSGDITVPVASYNNKSACDLLRHVAGSYIVWLGYFATKLPPKPIDTPTSLAGIQDLYNDVDDLVYQFLNEYSNRMDSIISGTHDACGPVKASAAQLFTHVYTHEFHHKGQLMNMCRTLGHIPPDTDVSLLFEQA